MFFQLTVKNSAPPAVEHKFSCDKLVVKLISVQQNHETLIMTASRLLFVTRKLVSLIFNSGYLAVGGILL